MAFKSRSGCSLKRQNVSRGRRFASKIIPLDYTLSLLLIGYANDYHRV